MPSEEDTVKDRPAGDGKAGRPFKSAGKSAGSHGQIFHVPGSAAGRTVATFLRQVQPGMAWSRVRGLFRGRLVMIDGNICTDEARRLKGREVVKLLSTPAAAPPDPSDLRIVHLDDHVVVVEKPSGVTTVRHHEEKSWPARRRQMQPTLDEMLPAAIAKHLQASRPRGKVRQPPAAQPRRPGPVLAVHRIDRETSGLVVFARNVPAARILAEQFRQHTTHRRYLAVVRGRAKQATIRSHLLRDRGDGRRGSAEAASRRRRPDSGDGEGEGHDEGKTAVTHVRVIERYGRGHTLVECTLETGRTHQIRIHLSEAGHPLCGERVYGPRRSAEADGSGAARVALHAAELGFVHPHSGEELRFTSPLPRDLRDLVAALRRQAATRDADSGG
jgi:23S rRNA pseudouridine1911/1915/1917 synthase